MLDITRYSVKEVAKMTGKTPETVRSWIVGGKLKARKPPGCRDYIIRQDDFERFWYGDDAASTPDEKGA